MIHLRRWRTTVHQHPANIARHDISDRATRIGDAVCAYMGSIRFIVLQSGVIVVWVVLNLVAFVSHWDPYPFILLNLVFSTQAAYASPLILLSQNNQTEHDRAEAEEDHKVDRQALAALTDMRESLDRIESTLNSR